MVRKSKKDKNYIGGKNYMKKIIEKLKKINSAISYYKNGNKKKEKLNIVEEEKEIFEISDKNNITIERQSFDASNEGNSKEDDINREQTFNEDRKKSLSEQTKDVCRNEKKLTILATIASVSIFIFQAYKSWNISNEYGIPIDSIKIDIKAPSLFMSLISIPILLSIVMCFSKKEYDRLNKIMFHTILIFSNFLYYMMIIIYCKKITDIYLALIIFTIVQIIIVVLFLISYFSKKLKIIIKTVNIGIYILLIIILIYIMLKKSEKFQIITLKNSEKKVVIGYYENEYLAFDYDEKDLKIYKIPVYRISTSDIEKIEMKEFEEDGYNLQKVKKIQIITLNGGKQRVILSEPNGEYGAFDFEEKNGKLIVYKIPFYEIETSKIIDVEPKEFQEVEYKNYMLLNKE